MIIEQGSLEDVMAINEQIPEFERKTSKDELDERLKGLTYLLLVAKVDGKAVGYKLSYAKDQQEFYIWLAGVIPSFRKQGLASKLRIEHERFAKNNGYKAISVKSMNRYPQMLRLLIANDYKIVGYQPKNSRIDGKILFLKIIGG